ncbi:MAG: pilus assembly protein [Micrococcales bacterium]|nr:pilus assembly protein [Micrococcales bacterium]
MRGRLAVRFARGARDAGQASLELITYALLVTLVTLACVQGLYVTQAVSVAQQAARDGARAASQGQAVRPAVDRQVPDWAVVQGVRTTSTASSSRVEVEVRVPLMIGQRTVDWFTVTRTAVMPRV